jgi:hypothetical protein
VTIDIRPRRKPIAVEHSGKIIAAGGCVWTAREILVRGAEPVLIVVSAPMQPDSAVCREARSAHRVEPVAVRHLSRDYDVQRRPIPHIPQGPTVLGVLEEKDWLSRCHGCPEASASSAGAPGVRLLRAPRAWLSTRSLSWASATLAGVAPGFHSSTAVIRRWPTLSTSSSPLGSATDPARPQM